MAEAKKTKAAAQTTTQEGSLLEDIVAEMKIKPSEEGYGEAKQGVQALISELLTNRKEGQRVDRKLIDVMVAELDQRLSKQMDKILHHEKFQKLESAWRGLKFLIDRVDFRENIRVSLLTVSKEELLDDFEDATEIVTSGLYRHVYTAEYGQFGGKPFGALIANYEFGVNSSDLALLKNCASVAAMAHAPFIAAASPTIFGEDEKDFVNLPYLKDLEAFFEGPKYTKWRGFRDTEDARYVGLTMPRFMLRPPYLAEEGRVKSFNYEETVTDDHHNYLWGNTAWAMGSRIADSFAQFRWCPNIIGPQAGGAVEDLPIHNYEAMGEIQTKIPTEILLSERREYELSEEGFIALTMRKESDNAAFFSANSCQKPKYFGISEEGKEAETNSRLGMQLPYIFIISRLAHYLKVLQREQIGSWKERSDLQKELNNWISQYVIGMDNPPQSERSRRPLRKASIVVEDLPGNPGWYKVDMKVVPHLKYMGAFFTLSLVGKLDKD